MPMTARDGPEEIPLDILNQPERLRPLMLQLRKYCTWLAARYDAPIYLVGSVIQKRNPRDVDVRAIITAERARAMFGSGKPSSITYAGWHRVKLEEETRRGADMRLFTSREIDFQIQIGERKAYDGLPMIRLDDWFTPEQMIERAPEDGEPLTEEDREAVEKGLADVAAGRIVPHSEVQREWDEMDAKEDAAAEELRILKTRIADAWRTSHLLGTAFGDVVKMCEAHPLPAGQAIAHLEAALKVIVDLVTSSGEFRTPPGYKVEGRRKCPDGATCHHGCAEDECFRVRSCGPFTAYGGGWTEEDKAKFGGPVKVEQDSK